MPPENCESKITGIKKEMQDLQENIVESESNKDKIAMERAERALEYADAINTLRSRHEELHEVELMLIEATSDAAIIGARNQEVKNLLTSKRTEVEESEKAMEKIRDEGKIATAELQACLRRDEDEVAEFRAYVQGLLDQRPSLEDYDSEMQSEKARLELMAEGNPGMILEFEERAKKITSLSQKLESVKAGSAEVDQAINDLKAVWEPQLDDLVKKISDSFSNNMSQIHCAGEVGIHKDEDFEEWAIEIRVKFR